MTCCIKHSCSWMLWVSGHSIGPDKPRWRNPEEPEYWPSAHESLLRSSPWCLWLKKRDKLSWIINGFCLNAWLYKKINEWIVFKPFARILYMPQYICEVYDYVTYGVKVMVKASEILQFCSIHWSVSKNLV